MQENNQRRSNSFQRLPLIALAAVLQVVGLAAATRAEVVERPLPMFVERADETQLRGRLVEYNDTGFDLEDAEGNRHRVGWEELPPARILRVHRELLAEDDADAWFSLGVRLRGSEGGQGPSDAALARAVAVNPALKERVERVKSGGTIAEEVPATQPGEGVDPHADHPEGELAAGPHREGIAENSLWGPLSDEVMASSVEELKAFAAQTQQKMAKPLTLVETKYFLFYSDLSAREAATWSGVLDEMYDRMINVFGLEKGRNIFRGKCLVFVFQSSDDYRRFQIEMHGTNPGLSAGMCHSYGNGYNHVAFYRQENDSLFAHVLVHETAHAFIHRYRSPVHVPTWANEGLAEYVAAVMIPSSHLNTRGLNERLAWAMRAAGNSMGGGFFDAQGLNAVQYPIAFTLTAFMINQSGERYANFINAIKDGKTWRDALENDYGVTLDRLVQAYGQTMGVEGLVP